MARLVVLGEPVTQGSKVALGGGRMRESSRGLADWRRTIAFEARAQGFRGHGHEAPVAVRLRFLLRRPKSHYRSTPLGPELRSNAPRLPAVKPDLDKLVRAVLDALTEVAWADDALVTHLSASKEYAGAVDAVGLVAEIDPIRSP